MRRRWFLAIIAQPLFPLFCFRKKDKPLALIWIETAGKNREIEIDCEIPNEWHWLGIDDLRRKMKERYPAAIEYKMTEIWPASKIYDLDRRYYRKL